MSNPNEEEKLTPSSRKSYDRTSTPMADKSEIENPDELPEPSVNNEEHEDVDAQEQKKTAKKYSLAELFRALISSANPENGGPEERIFRAVIKSVTEASTKNENPIESIGKALAPFITVEKASPDSTDEAVEASNENLQKTRAVFDIVFDCAAEAGIDTKDLAKELKAIQKEKEDELPGIEQDNYEIFERNVRETLANADEATLEEMHEEFKKLRAEIADDTQLEEGVFDKVIEAETLLAELVEVRDDTASQEVNELQQAYDKKFAEVIVTVFESAGEASFNKLKEGRAVNLRKEEQQKADHLIKLLLSGNDPAEQKSALVAALLTSFPVEGDGAEEALAIRTRILGYARLAGLSEEAILDYQVSIAREDIPQAEAVNDLESIPALNAFERKVEEQITNASAERVREIQDTWRELLESVDPDSETAAQAKEAIAVLGEIIKLKELQAARDRGEDVDFSTLIPPDELALREESGKEPLDQSGKDRELSELLASLFSSMREERTQDDYELVNIITHMILASEHTKAQKKALIAEISVLFPKNDEVPLADERMVRPLQVLFGDVLAKTSKKELEALKTNLLGIVDIENPPLEIKKQIHKAIGSIDALIQEKQTPDALQHPVEKPGTAQESSSEIDMQTQFAKDIRELVMQIDPNAQITSAEGATIEILFSIVAYPNQRTRADMEQFLAEKKIATLMAAFHGHDEEAKLRKALAAYSYDLNLNNQEIKKAEERLLKQTQEDPFVVLEKLVYEQIKRLTPADTARLQEQFVNLLSKIDADTPAQAIAQEATSILENMAGLNIAGEETRGFLSQDNIAELERARNIIYLLEERPNMPAAFPELRIYIDELTEKLKNGMTEEQMEEALHELNKRVLVITREIKKEIHDDGESTVVKDRAQRVIFLETSIDNYRKLLIHGINKNKPQTVKDVSNAQLDKIDSLMAQSAEINSLTDEDSLTASKFDDYLEVLEDVLEDPSVLTSEQLQAVYGALLTQDAVVRRDLELQGKYEKIIEFADRTRQAQMELYKQMVVASINEKQVTVLQKQKVMASVNGNNEEPLETQNVTSDSQSDNVVDTIRNVEKNIGSTVRERAHARGDYYLTTQKMLGPTVVEAPVGSRHAEPGTRFQVGAAIDDLRSMPTTPDPALPPNLGANYTEIATNLKKQPEFSNPTALENRLQQLNSIMEDGLRAGVSLRDMPQAQALARQIQEQRQELAVMEQMYKGRMEERIYKDEDEVLYEGYVHTALGERIKRIQIELGIRAGASATYVDSHGVTQTHDRRSDEQLIEYYTELRKWVKILLKNDVRNNPGKAGENGALNLSNERYKKYSEIAKALRDGFDPSNAADAAALLSNVNYMFDKTVTGGDFLRYFMRNTKNPKGLEKYDSKDFNPDELLGVDYRHAEGTSSFGLPKSLEDTMAIMARQYSSEKFNYRTGGDHELIDGEGNFKFNNFYYLIREQMLYNDILYNKDGQINPMQKITVKGDASSVSLAELLILMPEYLSQRNFEIQVDKDGDIVSGWGRQTEHPEFTWEQAQQLGAEVEFRIMTHEARIQYVQAGLSGDKGKYLQLMEYLHKSNHWTRANNILWLMGLPSAVTNGSQEILDVVGQKEAQGSLGKAISDMLVGYNYINEVAKYHKTPKLDHHGHPVKKKNPKTGKMEIQMREKTFNENMFYRFLEPNGANTFVVTMAEGSLNNYSDAKREYGAFLKTRLEAAAAATRSQIGSDAEKSAKLDQKLKELLGDIDTQIDRSGGDKNVNLAISFTESKHLSDFFRFADKEILGKKFTKKEDELKYFRLKVRNDLLDNLKTGFFAKLAEMQVHEIDELPEGKKKGEDRKDTYLFLRAKKTKVRFGSIKFGDETIEDLLKRFDPQQIKQFDYSNKIDDPDNPFAEAIRSKDPDKLRKAIDRHMDQNANPQNYKFFKDNEKMMLAFLKHVNRIERGWINHFRDIPENEITKLIVKGAMQKCVEKAHGIDDTESEYAWWQARDYIYIWGISDWLDDTGIGFRMGGKIFHTGKWRAHRGGKDGGGNPHTYDEIGATGLPFLNAIQIHDLEKRQELGHQSIFSLLQGGHGSNITPRALRSFRPRSQYSIAHDSEELYVASMLTSGAELVDLLSTTEVDFSNIVSFDTLGNVVFDYGKARELFKKWRKAIRYSYQKNGLDYREKIWVDGQEKTLFEYFFGKKTRAISELIRRETGRSFDDMFRDPADAVMASIIAAEVYEHRRMHATAHHWSIQNVIELEKVIREFMQDWDLEEDEHGDVDVVAKGNPFTRKVFNGALKAYHTSYQKMYSVEFGSSMGVGVMKGLWAFIKTSGTKGKWIY